MSGHDDPVGVGAGVGDLARVGAGFKDPTQGAQQTFRTLLDAMSRPGRLHALPATATAGLAMGDDDVDDTAPPIGIGMAATLLTLLDADTPVALAGAIADARTRAWIRFHTSARAATGTDVPTVAAGVAAELVPAFWEGLPLGSDAAPQDGATLVVEVEALRDPSAADPDGADPDSAGPDDAGPDGGVALTLRGPGIASTQALVVHGLPVAFWQWREQLRTVLPRGIDLVLVQGSTLAAIPRSSRIDRSR